MKQCPLYKQGKAIKSELLRNEVVFCHAEVCPYNKELPTTLYDENITLCSSKGLLKKTELENSDTNKKSNKPLIPFQSNLRSGDLTRVRYIKFKQLEDLPLF